MKARTILALFCSSAMAIALVGGATTRDSQPASEQAAIQKMAESFVDAFQKRDAEALAAFWTPDGDYRDLGGRMLKGRKAIAADFAELFAENKGMMLRIEIASVQFPTPDTAIEDGVTSVLSPDSDLPNRARYTNFFVKKDGKWLLSSVRESAYTPPTNYEFLRPIEWVIGEWVEDTKGNHVGRVAFEWSPDQNYIIASRAVGVNGVLLDNGSQRIGWDPSTKMLRSWNFESDGGFGHGAWVLEGDKWVNRVSSVLRSGSIMTSTTIVTRVDGGTITWQAKEQMLDGKPVPDSPVITMKRVR